MINKKRQRIQWLLLPIVFIVVGLGWKYPLLGYIVPVVMLTGLIGGFINGRYVCGNLCPRGSLLDRIISKISFQKQIPNFFRSMYFRVPVVIFFMLFMTYRISLNPTSIEHIGKVFWLMCTITTAIAVILGLLIHQRAWCAFCPMGTMQNWFGGGKNQLLIDDDICTTCKICEKKCPFQLESITDHKKRDENKGLLNNRDCLKCSECVVSCPKKALSWPRENNE